MSDLSIEIPPDDGVGRATLVEVDWNRVFILDSTEGGVMVYPSQVPALIEALNQAQAWLEAHPRTEGRSR
jgi:hypothetical protein